MSADAPVLVVRPLESDIFLGGSGVVAEHVNALGATAHFCSVIGQDADAEYVRVELGRRRVSADLIVDPARPTTVKTRYICDGKKMLNVNQFRDFDLEAPIAAQLREKLEAVTAVADAIIICDFGYGVVTKALLQTLCECGKTRNVPVVGDVQCSSQLGNVTRMKGITLVTPSEREARLALCDRDSGIADLGAMIMAETGNRSVVITLGERGLMILEAEGEPVTAEWKQLPVHEIKRRLRSEYLPSFAKMVVDSMGAGDAMLATITCCLATGASLMESAFIGNCSAAVECSKMGNITVGREELLQVIDQQFASH